jgi:hypothetical protein
MKLDFLEAKVKELTPVHDVFDVESNLKKFDGYLENIKNLVTKAENFEITQDKHLTTATEMMLQSKNLIKKIDTVRLEIVAKPKEFAKKIDGFAKKYKDQLEKIGKTLQPKLNAFEYQKELQRRKKQKEIEDKMAKQQAEMDKEAKDAKVEPVKLPPAIVPKETTTVKTDMGSAKGKMVWTFQVEEPGKVPREYLVIDRKLVQRAIDGGLREIPGINIYETAQVDVRRK